MMGKINHFLGLNIWKSKEGIFVNQEFYKKKLFECFRMTNCSDVNVPMTCGTCLSPSLDKIVVNLKTYKSMIGSLLYLTASRHDIMFYGCNCARNQANPKEPHLTSVKNIFRYLVQAPMLGILYHANTIFFFKPF